MDRIEEIRQAINDILIEVGCSDERINIRNHLYSVSQFCAFIAQKRGENSEIATIAGLLHDIYTLKTLESRNHASLGSQLAKVLLKDLDITTEKETQIICSAINNHSNKKSVHSEFDEILKDADVMQHCLYNIKQPVLKKEILRYESLKKEFGLLNV